MRPLSMAPSSGGTLRRSSRSKRSTRSPYPTATNCRRWRASSTVGFLDPSGGSQDAMTLAISHRDEDRAVLDAVREVRPPFSPEAVVREFAALLHAYAVTRVRGDRYGGEWPREQVRKAGIEYEVCETAKSDLYKELLPALNSGHVELLDHTRLRAQLAGLERRTARGGRDSIDHAPGSHDDLINAAAGRVGVRHVRGHDADPGVCGQLL